MEIIIHQAILHVLDTTLDAPVLSGSGMEMTAEKTAYLQNHIEKLLASDEIRQCRPLPDSAFRNELEHNGDFVDLSCRIAGVLFDYMHAHTTIPGADLAVVDFTRDGEPWLGILKLNYKNGYTHYTETVEGAPVNSIIQQRACLPTQSGKVEEGALVNLTDYSMKLLEKKFDIDGHKDFYLSTVVFQYTTAQPEKKKLQAIQEAAVQAVQENYADQPHVEAQVAMLIANQAADNDNQVSIQQVRQQLEEEYPLAAVPFDDYVEKSDVLEAPEQPVTVTPARIRRMESRSIHTANGIEVKIPTELLNSDNEVVRFTEEHYDLVVHNARLSGRSKSTYLHDLGIGHKPSLPMTAEQEEALKGLIGARSELVYVRNALHALPQTERLKLFKRADFMERWLQGINTLIEELSRIRDKFLDML